MIYLIYGGSGSGKSEYAEKLAASLDDNRYYIATMKALSDEDMGRVKKHRMQREGKGFVTIEMPTDISRALNYMSDRHAGDCVDSIQHPDGDDYCLTGCTALLECVSNLLANEMFVKENNEYITIPADIVSDKIINDIEIVSRRISNLVIVSNDVFEDSDNYDEQTLEYINALGRINAAIAEMADVVTEVVYGIPIAIKGNAID